MTRISLEDIDNVGRAIVVDPALSEVHMDQLTGIAGAAAISGAFTEPLPGRAIDAVTVIPVTNHDKRSRANLIDTITLDVLSGRPHTLDRSVSGF